MDLFKFLFLPLQTLWGGYTGCVVEGKTANTVIIYAITAAFSLMIFAGYIAVMRKKSVWFGLLLGAIFVVNAGYLMLAVSRTLAVALWANRIAYAGSVLLPLSMLMIILHATHTPYKKYLWIVLAAISAVMFIITASPGILNIYYKEVAFALKDGVGTLEKVYGPWHGLYLVYLIAYFAAMLVVIAVAGAKRRIKSSLYVFVLVAAVFVNIGIWLVEQFIYMQFEMLSISYIITGLFLLCTNLMEQEAEQRLKFVVDGQAKQKRTQEEVAAVAQFNDGKKLLTRTECAIFELYILGKSTKEVLAEMNITENTLKYHNKNIYSKLCVKNRKELIARAGKLK